MTTWEELERIELRLEEEGLGCMREVSSECSPIRPSVRMTRFPASLDVWEDREEEEWRMEPCRFRGLERQTDKRRNKDRKRGSEGRTQGGQSDRLLDHALVDVKNRTLSLCLFVCVCVCVCVFVCASQFVYAGILGVYICV